MAHITKIDQSAGESGRVNLAAKNKRHKRVFLRSLFFSRLFRIFSLKSKARSFALAKPVTVTDPLHRFLRQMVVIGIALFMVNSIIPTPILETGFTAEYFGEDGDILDDTGADLETQSFFMNEEGFLLKPSPASEASNRIGMTDSITHTIVSGDTLSSIAALYSVSVRTIRDANNISELSTLRVGQTLVIPSLDGVTHLVASSKETLSSIAKEYSVDEKLIREHNKLDGDLIEKGQALFIPGGVRKENPAAVARAGNRSGNRAAINTFDKKVVIATDAQPTEDKIFIFPTLGDITQRFRPNRHYGIDIGDRSRPDVWAAGAGTVVTASGGCPSRDVRVEKSCGHGYGNHVIIDHGDGWKTLYAHLDTIYVSEGDYVPVGQAIGDMGNTGRVFGATGIHLHYEVIHNGAKVNPENYTSRP